MRGRWICLWGCRVVEGVVSVSGEKECMRWMYLFLGRRSLRGGSNCLWGAGVLVREVSVSGLKEFQRRKYLSLG